MALNLISNFTANVASRNLAKTDAQLTASLAKLSSGTRVVSAKDDAASLAIGSRLRAEVAGLKQARVNAGQASSLLQIADGAFSTIADILVRAKALAVQAASGQLSGTERSILDAEFQALKSEITRISEDTEFNGTALIKGSDLNETKSQSTLANFGIQSVLFDTKTLKESGNVYRLEYSSAGKTFTLVRNHKVSSNAPNTAAYALTTAQQNAIIALKGTKTLDVAIGSTKVIVRIDRNFNLEADIKEKVSVQIDGTHLTDLTAKFAYNNQDNTNGGSGITQGSFDALGALAALGIDGKGAGYNKDTGILKIAIEKTTTGNEVLFHGVAGVSFNSKGLNTDSAGLTTNGVLAVKVGGKTIGTVTLTNVAGGTTRLVAAGFLEINIGQALLKNNFTDNGQAKTFTFQVGTGTSSGVDTVGFNIDKASAEALKIGGNNIKTAANSLGAIDALSAAINKVNNYRANVGASQNRLSFASTNLAAGIQNAEAARSQLLDLNIASEITTFTSKQVLAQAGVAMLAQANQLPRNLLKLLG